MNRLGEFPVQSPGNLGQEGGSDCLDTLNDHSVWEEARSSEGLGQMAVSGLVRETSDGLSRDQWQKVPPAIRSLIEGICRGDTSGTIDESLNSSGLGSLDWRRLLQKYVGEAIEVRPVFGRPPRRFPDLVGIVPAQLRSPTKPIVMGVIDTRNPVENPCFDTLIDGQAMVRIRGAARV